MQSVSKLKTNIQWLSLLYTNTDYYPKINLEIYVIFDFNYYFSCLSAFTICLEDCLEIIVLAIRESFVFFLLSKLDTLLKLCNAVQIKNFLSMFRKKQQYKNT